MIVLIVLIVVFILCLLFFRFVKKRPNTTLSGRIALSVMLLFSAIGHFKFPQGMAMMIPEFIPSRETWVYATGFIEIVAAIGLLLPKTAHITGIMLILFFILILPANINAALLNLDYQKGTYDGSGVRYLWFRVPLQLLFILWTYWFAVRPGKLADQI